jgi:hypothetical protein
MTSALSPVNLSRDPLNSPDHFARGPPRKGHEKDAVGIGAVHNQMGDAMSQSIGFTCSRARDDEERLSGCGVPLPDAMFDGPSQFSVELVEIRD